MADMTTGPAEAAGASGGSDGSPPAGTMPGGAGTETGERPAPPTQPITADPEPSAPPPAKESADTSTGAVPAASAGVPFGTPDADVPARTDGLFGVVLPLLAGLVGLVALGSAVWLDMAAQERDARIVAEIAQLRDSLEALSIVVTAPPATTELDNDGIIDGLLALQDRIVALETEAAVAAEARANQLALPESQPLGGQTALAEGPTEDCIPVGTRFVALTGEPYAICQTPEVIRLQDISGDAVVTGSGATIIEGGFERLGFGTCNLMVISADVEGFAELRVSCG